MHAFKLRDIGEGWDTPGPFTQDTLRMDEYIISFVRYRLRNELMTTPYHWSDEDNAYVV